MSTLSIEDGGGGEGAGSSHHQLRSTSDAAPFRDSHVGPILQQQPLKLCETPGINNNCVPPTAFKTSSNIDVASDATGIILGIPDGHVSRPAIRGHCMLEFFGRRRLQSLFKMLCWFWDVKNQNGKISMPYFSAFSSRPLSNNQHSSNQPVRGLLISAANPTCYFRSTPPTEHRLSPFSLSHEAPPPTGIARISHQFIARFGSLLNPSAGSHRLQPSTSAVRCVIDIDWRQPQTHREFQGFSLPRICGGT